MASYPKRLPSARPCLIFCLPLSAISIPAVSSSFITLQLYRPWNSSLNIPRLFPAHLEYSASHLHMACSLTLSAPCSTFAFLELRSLTLLTLSILFLFFSQHLSPVEFTFCIYYLSCSSQPCEGPFSISSLQDSAWQVEGTQ